MELKTFVFGVIAVLLLAVTLPMLIFGRTRIVMSRHRYPDLEVSSQPITTDNFANLIVVDKMTVHKNLYVWNQFK